MWGSVVKRFEGPLRGPPQRGGPLNRPLYKGSELHPPAAERSGVDLLIKRGSRTGDAPGDGGADPPDQPPLPLQKALVITE